MPLPPPLGGTKLNNRGGTVNERLLLLSLSLLDFFSSVSLDSEGAGPKRGWWGLFFCCFFTVTSFL